MAESTMVAGLRAKRVEIEGHVAELRKRLTRAERDLAHVLAVLALYETAEAEPFKLPAYASLSKLFGNREMHQLCTQALREAARPMTTREITVAVIRLKGWDHTDAMLRRAVGHRLNASLGNSVKRKRLAHAGWDGNVRIWKLPPSST